MGILLVVTYADFVYPIQTLGHLGGGGGGGVQLHDCMLHGRDGRERDNGMEPYRGRKLSAMTI